MNISYSNGAQHPLPRSFSDIIKQPASIAILMKSSVPGTEKPSQPACSVFVPNNPRVEIQQE
jgi:hypothetical protein